MGVPELLGVETLEDARGRMAVPADYRSEAEPTAETKPPIEYQARSNWRPVKARSQLAAGEGPA